MGESRPIAPSIHSFLLFIQHIAIENLCHQPHQTLGHETAESPCAHEDCILVGEADDKKQGFLGDSVVENPPANAGDTGWIPHPGRSHMLRSN